METENQICSTIKALRRQRGIRQEALAQALDVSVQAVSKWETGSSLPDILLLPGIARFFGVSIDTLFRGLEEASLDTPNAIPDDGRLRIVQFLGRRYLTKQEYDPKNPVFLNVEMLPKDQKWDVEIWGSADIKGPVGGGVTAGGGVNCGPVGDGVNAGGGVNCGPVGNGVNAGGGVNCGPVGDGVNAGGGINCGDIGGDVNAGGGVECGDIGGDANAGGGVECGDIGGDVNAGDKVECEGIGGDVNAGGGINCGDIGGSVKTDGDIQCKTIKHAERIECRTLVCKKGYISCDHIHYLTLEDADE